MRVSATAKYLRGSTRKTRPVTPAIKGKKVEEAAAMLRFMPQKAAAENLSIRSPTAPGPVPGAPPAGGNAPPPWAPLGAGPRPEGVGPAAPPPPPARHARPEGRLARRYSVPRPCQRAAHLLLTRHHVPC